jgi:hypothetical protein
MDSSPKNLCCQCVWANARLTLTSCPCPFPRVLRPLSRPLTVDTRCHRRQPRCPGRAAISSRPPGFSAAAGWPTGTGPEPEALSASHSVSTFVYGQHLVAALAAGQVLFALGDSNHPLKITEKSKDALMSFATETRCSYANIVVRKELFDKGVKSVEALADQKLSSGWWWGSSSAGRRPRLSHHPVAGHAQCRRHDGGPLRPRRHRHRDGPRHPPHRGAAPPRASRIPEALTGGCVRHSRRLGRRRSDILTR